MSDLAARAEQARTNDERARTLAHYSQDVARGRAKPPSPTHSGNDDLSPSQREAMRVLARDLDLRHDLSSAAKADLITDRIRGYRERNADREAARTTAKRQRIAAARARAEVEPPRYWLGLCHKCQAEMWVASMKPRVPVCQRCKNKPPARARVSAWAS